MYMFIYSINVCHIYAIAFVKSTIEKEIIIQNNPICPILIIMFHLLGVLNIRSHLSPTV